MKITQVDVMKLHTGEHFTPIVCRIYTDEGIYGDGEAALAYGFSRYAAFGAIKDFGQLILGKNPLENEVIWDDLFTSTVWAINGGPVTYAAMSAIDCALWDIRGKYFGVPVYTLLGGKRRDKLRTYASQLQYGWSSRYEAMATAEDYANVAKKAVAEGYDAIKVDFLTFDRDGRPFTAHEKKGLRPHYHVSLVEERAAAVREAIGPDVDIIMECHSVTDTNSAIQLANACEKYRIFALEEPSIATPKITRFIKDNVNMPIATGEHIYGRWQFAPYFENGSVQLMQPDIGTCGGITEAKKICDMAHTYDVDVQVHACGSPLSTVASLQLECVIPNFAIHEHHRVGLTDYMKRLCMYDYQPVDGKFSIPDLPGMGNELSDYALANCDKVTLKL